MKITINKKDDYSSLSQHVATTGNWFISKDGSALVLALPNGCVLVFQVASKTGSPALAMVSTVYGTYAPCDVSIEVN